MQTRFSPQPGWVLIGGCILAFLNAAVNAGVFLEIGSSVAQMSGEISRMARELGDPSSHVLGLNVSIAIAAFLTGAGIAGYTIHHPTLDRSLPYGRCMMFIGVCLLLAHAGGGVHPGITLAFGGFASGFQNAMATPYRGVILRTTHVTGLMTDVGSHIGMLARGHQIALWKIWVPGVVVFFFFLGGMFGTWLYLVAAPYLMILACAYLMGGFIWFQFHRILLKK